MTTIHYGSPLAEQRDFFAGTALAPLDAGIVQVSGPQRLSWLHALTSQQLEGLPAGAMTETLVLSPTGHIEHAAGVVDDGETTTLIVAAERAKPLTDFLTRMRFRMQVDVNNVSAQLRAVARATHHRALPGALTWVDPWPQVLPGGAAYGSGEHESWPVAIDVASAREVESFLGSYDGGLAGSWALTALRIAAGRPSITDIDNRTIPHEFDWLRTAVHLHKGCYRGQETVARVHNLGRPPRRLVLLHLDGSDNVLPQVEAPVMAGQRQVGTVRAAAIHYELGPIALALIKRSVPPNHPLTVSWEDTIVAANQELLTGVEGVTGKRPPGRGPLARLERKSLL